MRRALVMFTAIAICAAVGLYATYGAVLLIGWAATGVWKAVMG